jgi:uncharacterized protein YecT (DUF1311 family)
MQRELLFSLLVAHASASVAQDAGGFKCNPSGNQQEMNACAIRDVKVANAALTKQYKRAIERLSSAQQSQLRSEQRAWLASRDPGCKEEVKESEGGSIWQLEYFSCLTSVTQERTKELKVWGGAK